MIRKILPVVVLACITTAAQVNHHDPLTDPEIDKVRDTAQLPEDRLKLYIEFARVRLDKMQQAHADQKSTDRAQKTRDALQDFLDVYDELDTNVDTYADRGDDLRKALKPVIEADTEFGARLRAFKLSLGSTQEARDDDFLIGSALDAVDSAAKDHRDLLAEQEQEFKHKKKQGHKEASQRPQ